MSNPIAKLIAFAQRLEPDDGYWGPETLLDLLEEDETALNEFRSLFVGVTAEQLDGLQDEEKYGWIIGGAADQLDLLPDDPRLFKSADKLIGLTPDELLKELCSACILNDVNTVQAIASQIDVNTLNHNKQVPLCYAIGNNHLECVKILLANGANPNFVQNWGNTAMHICASCVSSKEIWKLLITHGGNPETRNNAKESAIDILRKCKRSSWLKD